MNSLTLTEDNLDDMLDFVGIRLVRDAEGSLFIHGRAGLQSLPVGATVVEYDKGRFRVEDTSG